MKIFLRILKWTGIVLGALLLLFVIWCIWLYATTDLLEPEFEPSDEPAYVTDSLRTYNGNSLRLDPTGIWTMRVHGDAFQRGEAIGKMGGDLLYEQEEAFVDQIYRLVPSAAYRKVLYGFITIFNRKLGKNVTEEYRDEIKAVSSYCTHDFDEFGNAYERQMHYHSAHDLGHVMQDYMLVGCTSFAVWGEQSADGNLLIGRNFDFYMGDDFAKRKILAFFQPSSGYDFVSVTWPGMEGVLSGMNSEGLTVTINAARLETPSVSATPISLLSREILQYASTIEEAWEIAMGRQTFVSESIMVGSANDGRAAIIEKTPSEITLYDPAFKDGSVRRMVCTNHYQSDLFYDREANLENIKYSDSMARFNRVSHLLDSIRTPGVQDAVNILRDRKGLDGEDIGYCNELSINQMLAHHSVVFQPVQKKVWVSTSPWQCGEFVCFDLNKVFATDSLPAVPEAVLPADEIKTSGKAAEIYEYRRLSAEILAAASDGKKISEETLEHYISLNPLSYNVYRLVGQYCAANGNVLAACDYFEKALSLEMKRSEREEIERTLNKLMK